MAVTRWEYKVEIVERRDGTAMSFSDHPHFEDLAAVLNRLGADGWEAWQINGSIVFFKRPYPEMALDDSELPTAADVCGILKD